MYMYIYIYIYICICMYVCMYNETGTYIYSVKLKGPYYLDWLKMHFPAWSKVF